ncbi:hypothetical protein H5T58_00300, partial [Candidatus Parcubacteria bacterium]|nr:hypothetical protein [Candidatus Parcubacteria bacterium]
MSEREVIEKLKEQLGSADRQIKRLIKTERRLLDLEEKMQRILKRYKCLQDISNFILSTRDIQKIFNFICEKFVFEMEVEKAVVLLKEKNFLSLKACAGYSRDESHSLLIKKFSLDFPILKEILEKGNLLIGPEKEIPLAFEEEFKMCHILGFAIFGEAKNALG